MRLYYDAGSSLKEAYTKEALQTSNFYQLVCFIDIIFGKMVDL